MATQSERLSALEQRVADHEARCEERLAEIRATGATHAARCRGLKNRTWGVVAALLAWALAQVWSANAERVGRLEAARPELRRPSGSPRAEALAGRTIEMTTKLTAHFALEELACTQHREIDNRPPPEVVATLRNTAARMEAVRQLLAGGRSPSPAAIAVRS
jgi:hypothetical protein